MAYLIIFGATGDLARRKLFPALGVMGGEMKIVAVGRREYTNEQFLDKHVPLIAALRQRIIYRQMDFTAPDGYKDLLDPLGGNLVYLSVDPQAVPEIVTRLGNLDTSKNAAFMTLILEKPFGRDTASACALNALLEEHFADEQLLRIDHYLFKDGVKLAMDLASQNHDLSGVMITSLTIRIMEREGVGTRGAFYSNTGAVRDVLQSHLLNVASVVATGSVHASWLRSLVVEKATFGQYKGFTEEAAVPVDSATETFAEAVLVNEKIHVTLITGKGLDKQYASIEYHTLSGADVTISIQPAVSFSITQHGTTLSYTLPEPTTDAYVRMFQNLLRDVRSTTVLDAQSIQATWEIADKLITLKEAQPLITYPRGGTGLY